MSTKTYPPPPTHKYIKWYMADRDKDRRQLWLLRLAASRKNRSTNMTEPLTDAVFTEDRK